MTAISSDGNAKITSFRRMIDSPSAPWRAAARSPKGTPMPAPMPTATSATASELRAPLMIIDSTSRPK